MRLRLRLFEHYLNIPLVKQERIPSGRLKTMATSDLPIWSKLYGMTLIEAVHSFAQFLGAVLTMQYFNLKLMIMILPFLLVSFFVPILSGSIPKLVLDFMYQIVHGYIRPEVLVRNAPGSG